MEGRQGGQERSMKLRRASSPCLYEGVEVAVSKPVRGSRRPFFLLAQLLRNHHKGYDIDSTRRSMRQTL